MLELQFSDAQQMDVWYLGISHLYKKNGTSFFNSDHSKASRDPRESNQDMHTSTERSRGMTTSSSMKEMLVEKLERVSERSRGISASDILNSHSDVATNQSRHNRKISLRNNFRNTLNRSSRNIDLEKINGRLFPVPPGLGLTVHKRHPSLLEAELRNRQQQVATGEVNTPISNTSSTK